MEANEITTDNKAMIEELEEKIESMKKDKEAKCKAAKEQLLSMLDVTADKYLTATGTAEALRVLRFAGEGCWEIDKELQTANFLAHKMAEEVKLMREKAAKLSYKKMDQLCDGFYDVDFNLDNESEGRYSDRIAASALALEMMRIDLCRNVGGAAEDMVEFIKRVESEIDATGKKLKELKKA